MSLAFRHPMPAKCIAAPKDSSSTAAIGFAAGAKCDGRSGTVEVKKLCPIDIQDLAFGISAAPACGSGGMFVQSQIFVRLAPYKLNHPSRSTGLRASRLRLYPDESLEEIEPEETE